MGNLFREGDLLNIGRGCGNYYGKCHSRFFGWQDVNAVFDEDTCFGWRIRGGWGSGVLDVWLGLSLGAWVSKEITIESLDGIGWRDRR